MQIVIPMSGFGERFRKAGYTVPKPLIEVDGKPIIEHVVNMFPGETDFTFIVNSEHRQNKDFHLDEILKRIAPESRIVSIEPHKLGPVSAVLQIAEHLDPKKPTVINYCDFTCLWDWKNFKKFVLENDLAGALPAYRGFHPHSLGTTNYAYIKEDEGFAFDIQEKLPFTSNRMNEYASSGTYYFATGELALRAMQKTIDNDLNINGEFYVSLAYKYLFENNLPTAVYPLQHFMQWGTPEDLNEYEGWSKTFNLLCSADNREFKVDHQLLMPMAGLGQRFADEGYETPKPLIHVSGEPMVLRSTKSLPNAEFNSFVLRSDMPGSKEISDQLSQSFPNSVISMISSINDGQARSVQIALDTSEDRKIPIIVGACDNALLYSEVDYEKLLQDSGADLVAWVARGHAPAVRSPEMFGWVVEKDGHAEGVSVKVALDNPKSDAAFTGTMTFKNSEILSQCLKSLFSREGKIKGEYYLDSVIEDAVKLGLRVMIFEVDSYISWGTPNELKTFEYWQSCFNKWDGHPYSIAADRWIASEGSPSNSKFVDAPVFTPHISDGRVLEN